MQHERNIISQTNKITYSRLIDRVDVVVIVPDARNFEYSKLPIVAASNSWDNYNSYSKEELLNLDDSELREIQDFHALDILQQALIDGESTYRLTKNQRKILEDNCSNYEVTDVTREDVADVLQKIKNCKHVLGPAYRYQDPTKNFAELHGYDMVESDYRNIIKQLEISDFIRELKACSKDYFGNRLFEFVFPSQGYQLKSGQIIDEDLIIYVKIVGDYIDDCTLAIISFHDSDDESPRRPFAE